MSLNESSIPTAPLSSDKEAPRPRVAPSPFIPVPQVTQFPATMKSSRLSVVNDQRAIGALLDMMRQKAGLSVSELARRMGCTRGNIQQYLYGRKVNPSVRWLVRYAEICGAQLTVEMPTGQR